MEEDYEGAAEFRQTPGVDAAEEYVPVSGVGFSADWARSDPSRASDYEAWARLDEAPRQELLPFEPDASKAPKASDPKESLDLFWTFVYLRHEAWAARFVDKSPQPWSPDPVIADARFTNVYRALDRGTKFLVEEVLEPLARTPFAAVFQALTYRVFNRIETFQAVKPHLDRACAQLLASREDWRPLRDEVAALPGKLYTGAYMCVSTPKKTGDRTWDAVEQVRAVYERTPRIAKAAVDGASLRDLYTIVKELDGFGDFLSYMCATDLCWPLAALGGRPIATKASVDEWAKEGPGAVKGLAILGVKGAHPVLLAEMKRLRDSQRSEFSRLGLKFRYIFNECADPHSRGEDADSEMPLSLLDIEHSLCEFQKWHRMSSGGHVKTKLSSKRTNSWESRFLTLPAWERPSFELQKGGA